jgi:ribosomal protein S18 acetylase RimI-like enzyme
MTDTLVRHATAADMPAIEDTLTDAFVDDPMMIWMYPDPDTRAAKRREFFAFTLGMAKRFGHTYGVDNNKGAAVWTPPDIEVFDEAAITAFIGLLSEQEPERAGQLAEGLLSITAHHPEGQPHFYLFLLGTAPAGQNKGLGSLMMKDMLDRCDRQGLGAYLESSNGRNVPFYERHGFKVIAEVPLGDEAVIRPMWRDPRPVE